MATHVHSASPVYSLVHLFLTHVHLTITFIRKLLSHSRLYSQNAYLLAAVTPEALMCLGCGNVMNLGFSFVSGFLSELCFGTDRSCRQF